ncbi:MAG: BrnT family toxin [Pseudomonadota bacterium]|nr:BrnT family toxin [Pseudomonadota bacterium]MDP1905759.1 BrnT family toxin [Pseudomonadota bacterium]MDP2351998.1 BrnT family toxin [Pseudomonadota bacterium]
MKITIDAAKDRMNVAKHGVSLADARLIEWETAVIWPDTRVDYGEPRQAALAYK